METLKTEGRYFELVQLARWACDLAPNIPAVWDMQAWNMAYNISCQIDNLPDRWRWVWSAIELLRDEGIPNNPNSFELYQSLAWTIFHKIGEQDDFAHPFYKQKLATLMQEVLGGGGDEATLEAMVAAPRTREELLKDADVRRFVEGCSVDGYDIVDGYFETLYETPSVPMKVVDLVRDPRNAAALAKVALFARARKLRDVYKMDPKIMLELRDEYKDSEGHPAPFDWRSPYPHAIYWANMGLRKLDAFVDRMRTAAEESGRKLPTRAPRGKGDPFGAEPLYSFQRASLERTIYYSMQSLVSRGRVLFDMKGDIMLDNGPDFRFADAALPLYEKNSESMDPRYAETVKQAYGIFLTNAVVQFSINEDSTKAHQYYDMLKQKFPEIVKPYKGYDDFLEDQFRQTVSALTFQGCRNMVRAYVMEALISASLGENQDAIALENEAKKLADHWVDREDSSLRGLINYDAIKESAIVDVFTGVVQMSPKQLQMLKQQIGPEKVDEIVRNAEQGKVSAPVGEKAPEKLQKDNTVKPIRGGPTGQFRPEQ